MEWLAVIFWLTVLGLIIVGVMHAGLKLAAWLYDHYNIMARERRRIAREVIRAAADREITRRIEASIQEEVKRAWDAANRKATCKKSPTS